MNAEQAAAVKFGDLVVVSTGVFRGARGTIRTIETTMSPDHFGQTQYRFKVTFNEEGDKSLIDDVIWYKNEIDLWQSQSTSNPSSAKS